MSTPSWPVFVAMTGRLRTPGGQSPARVRAIREEIRDHVWKLLVAEEWHRTTTPREAAEGVEGTPMTG